jgi:hypothetical protein
LIGWTGELPWLEEAALYADTTAANAASAKNPGTASHFLRTFMVRIFFKRRFISSVL